MKEVQVNNYIIDDFHYSESIKTLRTNLIFSGDNIKAVALTSLQKGEGKSTISFQLAASLAQNDLKTLLIEADLSAGVLQNTLKFREKVVGLGHYLVEKKEIQDYIYNTDCENLDIMFAGTRVINSAELLGSERFDKLINDAKLQYDYVIVDAAPIGQIVDCAVIAHRVDGVLMVIDANINNYKYEQKIKNQIEMSGGKVIGVVLNRVQYKKSDYYRKRYYNKYGSYSRYGYRSQDENKDLENK